MAEVVGTAYVRIRALTAGLGKDIKDGLDSGLGGADDDFTANLAAKLKSALGDAGDESGKEYSKRLSSSAKKSLDKDSKSILSRLDANLKKSKVKIPAKFWFGALAIPGLGAAIKLASSYILTLVGQLGFLVEAALGAGAAVGGIVAAIGLAAVPLMLAFKADTEAMDVFRESAQLTTDAWLEMGAVVQSVMLPALDAAYEKTQVLIPAFTTFGLQVGTILGETATRLADFLTTSSSIGMLGNILSGAADVFQNLMDTVVSLVQALLPLLQAVMPLAVRMSESIATAAQKFADFISASSDSGQLSETLTLWYDRAESVGRSIWNIIEALWEILRVGAEVVAPMFGNLEATTQRWVDNLRSAEGQATLQRLFEEALPVAREVNALIGDIIKLIGDKIVAPGGTEGLIDFLRSLRTEFLPAIADLAGVLGGNLGDSLGDLALSFVDLITALAESGALGTFTEVLGDLIDELVKLMQIPGVGDVIAQIAVAFGAWKAIKFVASPFIGVAKDIETGYLKIKSAAQWFAGGGLGRLGNKFTGFFKILGGIGKGIGGVLLKIGTAIVGFATTLWAAIVPLLPIIAIVAAVIAVIVGIYLAIKNWDKILPVLKKVWGAISDFFEGIWEDISNFFEGIGDWIADAWTAFIDFFQELPAKVGTALADFFTGIGTAISDWVASIPGMLLAAATALWEWIADAVPIALTWLGNFLIELLAFLIMLPLNIGTALVEAAIALWKWIQDAVPIALEWLGNLWTTIWDWITTTATNIVTNMVAFYTGIIQWLIDAAVALPGQLAALWDTIWNWIKTTAVSIATETAAFLVAVGEWIWDAIVNFPQNLARLAGTIWTWITNTASELVARAFAIRDAILGWIGDAAGNVASELGKFAQNVWDWIVDFVTGLPDRFINAITSFLSFGEALFEAIREGVMNGIGSLAEWGGNLMAKLKDALIAHAPGWLKGWLTELFGGGTPVAPRGLGTAAAATTTMQAGVRAGGPNLLGAMAPAGGGGGGIAPMAFGVQSLMTAAVPTTTAGPANQFATGGFREFAPINLVVQIGETDITNMIDARISSNDRATAQALWVRRR